MNTVRSQDGTTIAYDRTGSGPPLIVVGGAFSYRGWKGYRQLTALLADRYTVISYDRRGRGDSGDTPPYAVEREIDDLRALVEAAGDSAVAFGQSSGGVLALRAAAAGVPIERLAVYQPPFMVDPAGHRPPHDFAQRLDELTAAGRRGQAVGYFMTKGMGAPAPAIALFRLARPLWSRLKAVAHTLPYDAAIMGDNRVGAEPWGSIPTPTLVLDGGKAPSAVGKGADALAAALPNAERRTLEGQSHNVSMKALAPVLDSWFRG
jgi:pimeloyl-ACP methyl ester carboxylesterase